jgi:hypothetical protein
MGSAWLAEPGFNSTAKRMAAHPAVAECAVIGVADALKG